MKKYVAVLACLALSGCTIGGLVDRVSDECNSIVEENIDRIQSEVESFCIEAAEVAINQCLEELEVTISMLEDDITARIGDFLTSNGCVLSSTSTDGDIFINGLWWNCANAEFCQ